MHDHRTASPITHRARGLMTKARSTLLALGVALAGAASAEPLIYGFNPSGDLFKATTLPVGLTASPMDLGSPYGGLCTIMTTFACGGFGDSSVNFTVEAQAGYSFDVLGFSFEGYVPGPEFGPTGWAVYSSLDGFTQALISGSFAGLAESSLQLYDAGLTALNLVGPLELRIVSTGRPSLPAEAWLLDNIRLDVNVNAPQQVPEPASLALMTAGLLAAGMVLRQRRARTRIAAQGTLPRHQTR